MKKEIKEEKRGGMEERESRETEGGGTGAEFRRGGRETGDGRGGEEGVGLTGREGTHKSEILGFYFFFNFI